MTKYKARPHDAGAVSVANATSRSGGAVGNQPIIPSIVKGVADERAAILDFGAGKDAKQAQELRGDGLDVTAYDYGDNATDLHDPAALDRQYDVVYASNVLNVQDSDKELAATLDEIAESVKNGGVFVGNLPSDPRKGAWAGDASDNEKLEGEIRKRFKEVKTETHSGAFVVVAQKNAKPPGGNWRKYANKNGRGWINDESGEIRFPSRYTRFDPNQQMLFGDGPQEGDTRTNRAGNEEILQGGRWHLANPDQPATSKPSGGLPIMGQDVQPGEPRESLPELGDEHFDELYQRMEIDEYQVGENTLWRSGNPKYIPLEGKTGRKVTSLEASIHPKDYPQPDHDRQRLVVAMGMGVDSFAMLIHMKHQGVRPDVIHWADTGSERKHTYEAFDSIQKWCKENDFPPIVIVRRRVANAKQTELNPEGQNHRSYYEQLWNTGQLASPRFGKNHSCSIEWKLKPQRRFDENLRWLWDASEPPATAIGFDADEVEGGGRRGLKGGDPKVVEAVGFDDSEINTRRSSKGQVTNGTYSTTGDEDDDKYTTWFPLAEAGLDRQACVDLIREEGLPVPGKSACHMCPAAKDCEWQAMKGTDDIKYVLDLEDRFAGIQEQRKEKGHSANVNITGMMRSAIWEAGDKLFQTKKDAAAHLEEQGIEGKPKKIDAPQSLRERIEQGLLIEDESEKPGLKADPQPAPRFKNKDK